MSRFLRHPLGAVRFLFRIVMDGHVRVLKDLLDCWSLIRVEFEAPLNKVYEVLVVGADDLVEGSDVLFDV